MDIKIALIALTIATLPALASAEQPAGKGTNRLDGGEDPFGVKKSGTTAGAK